MTKQEEKLSQKDEEIRVLREQLVKHEGGFKELERKLQQVSSQLYFYNLQPSRSKSLGIFYD